MWHGQGGHEKNITRWERSEFILELKDVVKTFGGVTALDGVQFQLKRGEIHALMGENGAGKSTFIKVITGVHQPDSGLMLLEGEKITLRSTESQQFISTLRHFRIFLLRKTFSWDRRLKQNWGFITGN